jgi:hypothetical protein
MRYRAAWHALQNQTIKLSFRVDKKLIQDTDVEYRFLCYLDDCRDNDEVWSVILRKVRTGQQVIPRRFVKTKYGAEARCATVKPELRNRERRSLGSAKEANSKVTKYADIQSKFLATASVASIWLAGAEDNSFISTRGSKRWRNTMYETESQNRCAKSAHSTASAATWPKGEKSRDAPLRPLEACAKDKTWKKK